MFKEIFDLAFAAVVLVLTTLYIWKKLYSKEILNRSTVFKFIICCILLMICYKTLHGGFKPLFSSTIIMIFNYSIYKENAKQSIIMSIFSQLIVLISELIYVSIILMLIKVNEDMFAEQYGGTIISNACIALISVAMVNIKFVNKIYNKIIESTDSLKRWKIVLYSFIIIVIANILTALIYYKVSLLFLLLTNTTIIVIYTIFIFNYLKTNNNYVKVSYKYDMTLNSLKEYEDILSKYRISNHENKNQLLTIRAMVKNKKVASYIDEIIEHKIKDNEKLMFESLVIPEGGLRGLIYSKMLLMKENNIEYDLCVDKILKTTDLTSISDDLMLNICNIVGVYLDNAIEAVKDLDEKYIIIEIYLDETLNIAITNNYKESIDIDSIDKEGYSTKGGNHGYGLSLVKEILDNNDDIENVKHITDDEFTQEIKIKCKI